MSEEPPERTLDRSWRCAHPSRSRAQRAEVLIAADVHAAADARAHGRGVDPEALRCVALAVAGARQGHAFLELEPGDAELMRHVRGAGRRR